MVDIQPTYVEGKMDVLRQRTQQLHDRWEPLLPALDETTLQHRVQLLGEIENALRAVEVLLNRVTALDTIYNVPFK